MQMRSWHRINTEIGKFNEKSLCKINYILHNSSQHPKTPGRVEFFGDYLNTVIHLQNDRASFDRLKNSTQVDSIPPSMEEEDFDKIIRNLKKFHDCLSLVEKLEQIPYE
jgi:hypothetical protein